MLKCYLIQNLILAQFVNRYTVGIAVASSWLIPVAAAAMAASKSFEHNEMCIPSQSQTKVATVLGRLWYLFTNVTSKKLPNVHKSCPEMNLVEKWKFLKPLQKLYKNVGDLGKIIVAAAFEKLPKVQ